jgi:hypothetical protein
LTAIGLRRNADITICWLVLHPGAIGIPLRGMLRWRSTMRQLSAEARLHLYARSLSARAGTGIHTAALYGSMALIAAVVFGTLSIHPF